MKSYVAFPYAQSYRPPPQVSGPSYFSPMPQSAFYPLSSSRNLSFQHTPQKPHTFIPFQTQSESKMVGRMRSIDQIRPKEGKTRETPGKTLPTTFQRNKLLTVSDDEKYLNDLEGKMKVMIEENEKLLAVVEQKNSELEGYRGLERKVHLILDENARLNDVIAKKDREMAGKNTEIQEKNRENGLLASQNRIIDKQNEEIEGLVGQLEEMRNVEEENQGYKELLAKNQDHIGSLLGENGKLTALVEEKERVYAEIAEDYETLKRKYLNLEGKTNILLEENEKLQRFVNSKKTSWEHEEEKLRRKSVTDEKRLKLLILNNNQLNELLGEFLKTPKFTTEGDLNRTKRSVLEKEKVISGLKREIQELRENLQESREISGVVEELEGKIKILLEDNEKLNDLLSESIKEKEKSNEFQGRMEDLIQRNIYLEQAFNETAEELNKYRSLHGENEGLDQKIELLLEENYRMERKIEQLKAENQEIREQTAGFNEEIQKYQQENYNLSINLNSVFEENKRLNELCQERNENFGKEGLTRSMQEKAELLEQGLSREKAPENRGDELVDGENQGNYIDALETKLVRTGEDLERETKAHEETKNEFEKLIEEKDDLAGNLHEKCMILLEETSKMQENLDEKEREKTELMERLMDMEQLLTNKDTELREYQARNESITQEIVELRLDLDEYRRMTSKEGKKSELTLSLEKKRFENDSRTYTDRISTLEGQIEDLLTKNGDLQRVNEGLLGQLEELKEELRLQENTVEELNHEVGGLKSRGLEGLEIENKFEKEVESLKSQINHWKLMHESRDKEVVKLYDLLKARKNENNNLLKQNEELKNEAKAGNKGTDGQQMEKIAGLNRELERSERERNEAQREAELRGQEILEMKEEFAEKIRELEELREEYMESKRTVEMLEEKCLQRLETKASPKKRNEDIRDF